MRPIIMFIIGASASLFILGYAVHMFVGGLVSRPVEFTVIGIAEVLGASAIGWMTWDVVRRR